VTATSEVRPDAAAIRALLPRFTGTIEQVPPRFSAIKIAGNAPTISRVRARPSRSRPGR
jgi:tRNA U55 pseudouridine synthase TruB